MNTQDDRLEFSILKGGPLSRCMNWLPFMKTQSHLWRSGMLIFLTWVPLFLLAGMQGLAYGNRVEISFASDFPVHIRFLIVLPLMVFAERGAQRRVEEFRDQFLDAGLVAGETGAAFKAVIQSVERLKNYWLPELLIFALIGVNIYFRWSQLNTNVTEWMKIFGKNDTFVYSWAGLWWVIIAMPVFQFIMYRWLWRWIVWFVFMLKISRLPLQLNPAHPDKAAGLGFLGTAPNPFNLFIFAMSLVFSVMVAREVLFQKLELAHFYPSLIGFVILCILLYVAPLLVYIPKLAHTRRDGIFKYGALIQKHHHEFDDKWINGPQTDEDILGSPDASSLADLNSTYQAVEQMKSVPFDLKTVASGILTTLLPMLPLLSLKIPVDEVLKRIFQILF